MSQYVSTVYSLLISRLLSSLEAYIHLWLSHFDPEDYQLLPFQKQSRKRREPNHIKELHQYRFRIAALARFMLNIGNQNPSIIKEQGLEWLVAIAGSEHHGQLIPSTSVRKQMKVLPSVGYPARRMPIYPSEAA